MSAVEKINPREADYLLIIFEIKNNEERPRNKDIMKKLGVSKPTTSLMIKKLVEKNLIVRKKDYIDLTQQGLITVLELLWRHGVIELSLDRLGLSPDEACHVSRTIELIMPFDTLVKIWQGMKKPLKCPLGVEFPNIFNLNLDKKYYICGLDRLLNRKENRSFKKIKFHNIGGVYE